MAIVCIAGVGRGIGKTAVAEFLLARLEGWHAARVRVADEIPQADAARIGDEGFLLVSECDDSEVRRLRGAGAMSAAVLLAEPRGLEAGLDTLLTALPWAGSRYCPPQAEEAGDGFRVFQRGVAYFA
jgi:NAD(P)-dependent dehydrogenase (short-subunit alcohol dehydrogenase family)